jgi:hypothetical protein
MAGTHEDAVRIVELSKLGAMLGVPEVAIAIHADDFDPDSVDLRDLGIQKMLGYFETIATLVKNGLLDADLVRDWVSVAGLWKRVGPAAMRAREREGIPTLYENIEAMATGQLGAAQTA